MRNDIFNGKKNIINKRENNYQNELYFEKLREQELKSINESKKQNNFENKIQQHHLHKKDNINYNIKLNENLSNKNEFLNKKTINTIIIPEKNKFNNDLDENKKENKEIIEIINEKYVPLSNPIGDNACYVNVSIQLLYNVIPFRNYILSLKPNLNNFDELINNFYKIFEKYKSISMDNIFPIDTKKFRIILTQFSDNFFKFGYCADPVEFIIFLLNDIIIYNNDIIHKIFYIDTREQYNCIKCKNEKIIKYDKDNFFHGIYVEEILNYCEVNKSEFEYFCNKLFIINKEISYQVLMSCEKCKKKNINTIMEKRTICKQLPSNLLVSCIWSNKNPDLEQIIKFYFMIQNDFNIQNLYDTNDINKNYIFKGMILYSYFLYHYIISLYDYNKKEFILINDETISSFKSMYEMIKYLIVPEKNFCFYPVIIMYIENEKKDNINFNLNKNNYNDLIKKVKIYKQKKENLNNDKNSIKNKKDNKKEISKIEDDKNNNLNNNSNIFVEKMYNSLFIKRHENVEKEINNLKIKNDNDNKSNNNKTLSKSSNKISLDNNYFYNYLRNSNYNNNTTKNKK